MNYQARHYRQIASLLLTLRVDALDRGDLYLLDAVDTFQSRLVEVFRRDNPRFSVERFNAACLP